MLRGREGPKFMCAMMATKLNGGKWLWRESWIYGLWQRKSMNTTQLREMCLIGERTQCAKYKIGTLHFRCALISGPIQFNRYEDINYLHQMSLITYIQCARRWSLRTLLTRYKMRYRAGTLKIQVRCLRKSLMISFDIKVELTQL